MNTFSFKKTVLKNKLRVITVPSQNTHAVTILILVGTGSKYEQKHLNGISHFLEHLLFKGTKKRKDKIQIAETLDRVGGIYNAFTSEDYTGYFAKVCFLHFDLALDWVTDIYLNSVLPKKEIEKERGVIFEEINMYFDHPMEYVNVLWNKVLYGDQPAGWSILGTKETVQRIKRADLLNYMRKQYVASNTIVCVAGNFNEREGLKKIEKYFSNISTTPPKKKQKVIENQTKPQCLLETRNTDQTHFCLGVRGYNIFHPKKYAQEVLGVILGGMMSSRLFIKIREEMGASYYITTSTESNPDTGYLVTQAGADNDKIEKVIKVILAEYKKMKTQKVPLKELKKAKEYIKGKMALQLESSDAQASFFGLQELLKKEILLPQQIYKKIDELSPGDLLKVAKEIFKPQNLNLALIGPFKDSKKFEKLLKL